MTDTRVGVAGARGVLVSGKRVSHTSRPLCTLPWISWVWKILPLLVDQAGRPDLGGEGRAAARGTRHCFGPFLVIDLCVVPLVGPFLLLGPFGLVVWWPNGV